MLFVPPKLATCSVPPSLPFMFGSHQQTFIALKLNGAHNVSAISPSTLRASGCCVTMRPRRAQVDDRDYLRKSVICRRLSTAYDQTTKNLSKVCSLDGFHDELRSINEFFGKIKEELLIKASGSFSRLNSRSRSLALLLYFACFDPYVSDELNDIYKALVEGPKVFNNLLIAMAGKGGNCRTIAVRHGIFDAKLIALMEMACAEGRAGEDARKGGNIPQIMKAYGLETDEARHCLEYISLAIPGLNDMYNGKTWPEIAKRYGYAGGIAGHNRPMAIALVGV